MDNSFLKLTATDRKILDSFALMLNGLGAYLGDGYSWSCTAWKILIILS